MPFFLPWLESKLDVENFNQLIKVEKQGDQVGDYNIQNKIEATINNTKNIDIYKIAKSCNYKSFKTTSKVGLKKILSKTKNIGGPVMILIKINKGGIPGKRIIHSPPTIKKRFSQKLNKQR